MDQQSNDGKVSFLQFARATSGHAIGGLLAVAALIGLYVNAEEKGWLWRVSVCLLVGFGGWVVATVTIWSRKIRSKLRDVSADRDVLSRRNQDLTSENEDLRRQLSDASSRADHAEAALGNLPDTKDRNSAARDIRIATERAKDFLEGEPVRVELDQGTPRAGFHHKHVDAMHGTSQKLRGAEPVNDAALRGALEEFSAALDRFLAVFDVLGDSDGHSHWVRPQNPDRYPGTGKRVLDAITGESINLPPEARDQYRQKNPEALLADIPTLELLQAEVLSTLRAVEERIHELRHEWDLEKTR